MSCALVTATFIGRCREHVAHFFHGWQQSAVSSSDPHSLAENVLAADKGAKQDPTIAGELDAELVG